MSFVGRLKKYFQPISGSDPVDDENRTEWNRAWKTARNKIVRDVTSLDVKTYFGRSEFGRIHSATIALAPQEYAHKLHYPSSDCPICLKPADEDERLPASLYPQFEIFKGGLGVGIWVHPECFEDLEASDEPAPIPW